MRRKRKKNLLIAVLFCTLVFMGIGYATRTQLLTVGSTANIVSNFDVHFKSVELLEYESYVDGENKDLMQNGYGIGPTNTEAYMSAILKAPTEYVTYKAVIKNYGLIDAKITSIDIVPTADSDLQTFLTSQNKTLNDIDDYFVIEQVTGYELTQNTILESGEENELKLRVSFNSTATEIPDGQLQIRIRLTYTQTSDSGSSQTIPNNPHENESRWQVDRYGTVIAYDKADLVNGYLTVPATDRNGNPIRKITQGSFVDDYNIEGYVIDLDNDDIDLSSNGIQNNEITPLLGVVIHDTENYNALKQGMEAYGVSVYDSLSDIPIPEGYIVDDYKFKIDVPTQEGLQEISELTEKQKKDNIFMMVLFSAAETQHSQIYTLDLSNASDLKEISAFSFPNTQISKIVNPNNLESLGFYSFLNCKISDLDFSALTKLKEVGDYAFYGNEISGLLEIPSSVKTIGTYAFANNDITGLDLSHATSLEKLAGFYNNKITSLDLSGAPNLKVIGERAFSNNQITSLDLSRSQYLESIDDYAFDKNQISGQIYVNSTVERIGKSAFNENLISSIDLSNATNLKYLSGFGYNQITSVDLSKATKIETIGDRCFWFNNISSNVDLSNLTELKTIEEYAFYNMSISGTIVINSKVEKIGYQAFESNKISGLDLSNANSLTTIERNAFSNNEISGDVVFPQNIVTIAERAFNGNGSMYANINNATALTTIGDYAFYNTHPPNYSDSIIINSNVETIGKYAFDYKSIYISRGSFDLTNAASLKSIGYYAFGHARLIDIHTRTKEDFESSVTLPSELYYVYSGEDIIIKYLDVTCDKSGTCTANS